MRLKVRSSLTDLLCQIEAAFELPHPTARSQQLQDIQKDSELSSDQFLALAADRPLKKLFSRFASRLVDREIALQEGGRSVKIYWIENPPTNPYPDMPGFLLAQLEEAMAIVDPAARVTRIQQIQRESGWSYWQFTKLFTLIQTVQVGGGR